MLLLPRLAQSAHRKSLWPMCRHVACVPARHVILHFKYSAEHCALQLPIGRCCGQGMYNQSADSQSCLHCGSHVYLYRLTCERSVTGLASASDLSKVAAPLTAALQRILYGCGLCRGADHQLYMQVLLCGPPIHSGCKAPSHTLLIHGCRATSLFKSWVLDAYVDACMRQPGRYMGHRGSMTLCLCRDAAAITSCSTFCLWWEPKHHRSSLVRHRTLSLFCCMQGLGLLCSECRRFQKV